VISKSSLGEGGSTAWAQGGIAAAIGPDDDPALHAADTLAVGGGIADETAVAILTAEGPGAISNLLELGGRFDRAADGSLALGREAGHSTRRVIHAEGDATGAELIRALAAATLARPAIQVIEHTEVIDLVRSRDGIVGVLARHDDGLLVALLAPAVVLATGGVGRVYAHTTNPPEVTGDGIAMAARAGATLADLEFVQFHPTAFAADADPMPLLTEALRGEGAVLVDDEGTRFMLDEHADAELAPRDVVARAIWRLRYEGRKVFLDATTAVGAKFPDRFPTVFGYATQAGLDPRVDLLPVSPAAHYFMGGVAVDLDGRSSLPGLFAVGETASVGLHGANRLASNSLLDGMVFGRRVADAVADAPDAAFGSEFSVPGPPAPGEANGAAAAIRAVMWEHVGLVRDAAGLATATAAIDRLTGEASETLEGRNLATVAGLITAAAAARTESRGAHHRTDHPERDPSQARRSFVTPEPVPGGPLVVTARA
jgi:L-aspartate oxidase